MISCTEFIPAYSEFFKYIDQKSGRQAVYDFWDALFQPGNSPLDGLIVKHGKLRGYWENGMFSTQKKPATIPYSTTGWSSLSF